MTADETGVSFESPSVNSHAVWSQYVAFVEDQRSFVLVQQGNQMIVPIPKRWLDLVQTEEMRSLFEKYIPLK